MNKSQLIEALAKEESLPIKKAEEVVNTVPTAIGTVAAAAVFGGTVSMVPEPVGYIKDDINREGRIVYGDARRKTKQSVANMILILFQTTK